MSNKGLFILSIAIFSMFFGAGNVIFPLELGIQTQSQLGWGFLGLFFTAIGGPLLGLLGATLFRGQCLAFFNQAGKIPGTILIFVTLALLGPFAVLPRCVVVSYAAVEPLVMNFPFWAFSSLFCLVSLLRCWKRSFILPTLGKVLSPILMVCLMLMIYKGIVLDTPIVESSMTRSEAFAYGLSTGYDTMDLIAAIYFSAGIWALIEIQKPHNIPLETIGATLKAGIGACFLLGIVYLGLSYCAAKYSDVLAKVPQEQLITHLAYLVLGPTFGAIANIAVALACLTTVISLTMTIGQIISREIFVDRVSYRAVLVSISAITAMMSHLGFNTIMAFIHPVVSFCYPLIIVLTIVNIAKKLTLPLR